MSSVDPATSTSFDGELTRSDFDPNFALVSLLADVSEDFLDWYEQTGDELETAASWQTWFAEATGDNNKDLSSTPEPFFLNWLDDIGFDYKKYFDLDSTESNINKIKDDYEVSEVRELIGIAVKGISTDAEQAGLLTESVVTDYSSGVSELIKLIDSARDSTRGHNRA